MRAIKFACLAAALVVSGCGDDLGRLISWQADDGGGQYNSTVEVGATATKGLFFIAISGFEAEEELTLSAVPDGDASGIEVSLDPETVALTEFYDGGTISGAATASITASASTQPGDYDFGITVSDGSDDLSTVILRVSVPIPVPVE
ncbi:MAG: hypothetical protein AAGC55_05600 [Myxococcota bacterium]